MVNQPQTRYAVSWIGQMAEIPRQSWDAMALPLTTPFLEWSWLNAMETSGSAIAQAGWQPHHLTVWRDGDLVGAAPMYIKGHSYGEFVFDHQWADLAHRLGVQYYPKLLGMSPFTPAEGYRFLIAPGEDELEITAMMVAAIDQFCKRYRVSGCNFLYVDPQWRSLMEQMGFMAWRHHSYIWQNNGFTSFDDYLQQFNANQRRNIKRERKAVEKSGLRMKVLAGGEIPSFMFPLMHDFYADTCDKFGWWGSKYLTRRFFEQLDHCYRDRVMFAAAYPADAPDGDPVGMSFCLYKGENLYGRYWGSHEDIDCLHFNACYYTPIEWAIEQGIQSFDPGAGGRHKKRRGFPAAVNHSLHRLYDNRLRQILANHIDEINAMEEEEAEAINAALPFKKAPQ